MKKLIAILMLMVAFAFAGDGMNDFKTPLGSITPETGDRIHFADVSEIGTTGAMGKEYVTWGWMRLQFGGAITVDTNTVVADASAATTSVFVPAGKVFSVIGLYPGGTWDSTDFLEFNDADSNAATIDTMNLYVSDWKTEGAFNFYCPTDSTIYINLGDTVSVASTVSAKVVYEIK